MRDPLIPFNESGSLAENLVVFYDEFVEFQAYCALLCDALSCMATTEMGLDDATQRGVTAFSGYLKRRVEDLKISLRKIQEKSCEEN